MLFRTHVIARRELAPGFIRLTVHSADLGDMAWHGVDQRIKLFLPKRPNRLEGYLAGLPERGWKALWRSQDLEVRPYLRTFTIADGRPDVREIDIDFFVDHAHGPASRFAQSAAVGDELVFSGPLAALDHKRKGVQFAYNGQAQVLIAGDETAFPAMLGIHRELPGSVSALFLVQANSAELAQWMRERLPGRQVRLLTDPQQLYEAATHWAHTAAGTSAYAWFAAEHQVIGDLKRVFSARHRAVRLQAQGYWNRRGRAALS
ncbi:siderophore-interacting protein [Glutamicibacter endophyticus]|uniref:siderophore-interacting protein n=1 Tax=Glutamicibacter endophyticus TaxID=1522174 RepID=UPI003AF12856